MTCENCWPRRPTRRARPLPAVYKLGQHQPGAKCWSLLPLRQHGGRPHRCPSVLSSSTRALARGGQGARGRSVCPGDTGPLGHLSCQEHEGPLLPPALTLSSYIGIAVSSGRILEILFFVKKNLFLFLLKSPLNVCLQNCKCVLLLRNTVFNC